MAIKRLTIEIDDAQGTGPTAIPDTAKQHPVAPFKQLTPTGIPSAEDTDAEGHGGAAPQPQRRHMGRTASDLVAEYINEPRVMATVLMFVPFPFFATSLKSLTDLHYPAAVGLLLNAVWFLVGLVTRSRKK